MCNSNHQVSRVTRLLGLGICSLLIAAGNTFAQSISVPTVEIGAGDTAEVKVRYFSGGDTTNVDFYLNYEEGLINEDEASVNCAGTVAELDFFYCTVDTVGNRIRGIGVNLSGSPLSSGLLANIKLPVLPGAAGGKTFKAVTGNFADSPGETTSFSKSWALDVSGASGTPAKPTGIRATDGSFNDRVRVTFNTVPGATVYRVFRCSTTGPTCGSPIGFPKTGTFDDKKGIPGQVYYYRVRACTPSICGKFSAANTGFSSTAPAKPTGIRATDGSFSGKVRVTFNTVAGATVYRVFRCQTAGQTCGLPIGYPKSGVFDDRKGASGVVYYYRVRACTTSTCGKFSAANTGYRGSLPSMKSGASNSTPSIEADILRDNAVPIPTLSSYQGRWLLILMTLALGLTGIRRRERP